MNIKQLIQNHAQALTLRYGKRLLPSHRKALDAMLACRRSCGEFYTHCDTCKKMACIRFRVVIDRAPSANTIFAIRGVSDNRESGYPCRILWSPLPSQERYGRSLGRINIWCTTYCSKPVLRPCKPWVKIISTFSSASRVYYIRISATKATILTFTWWCPVVAYK